jgi:pyruvate kinase
LSKTKIVATVGPASESREMLLSLVAAGVDLFRVNMSHGSAEWHRSVIRRIRSLPAGNGDGQVGVLVDLSGPKIRVGEIEGGQAELSQGGTVRLVGGRGMGGAGTLYVNYGRLGEGIRRGGRVLIDDGMIELRVSSVGPEGLVCRVVKGGVVKEHKGVNFPGLPLKLPAMTKKDIEDLKMAVEEDADYVALSFVRDPSDVSSLKRRLKRLGADIPVISKIERPEAVGEIKRIIEVSDGVMVARGDLGVEMDPALVPTIQRRVIRLCNEMGRPVITATQMLESMVSNPRPTRAEASDVAGAVADGTDAVMLSEETATGSYPEAAVKIMDRIAREAEKRPDRERAWLRHGPEVPVAIARSACQAAEALKARAIICFTRSGATALLISKLRPVRQVIAATPSIESYRRMRLYYGVTPLIAGLKSDTDSMVREVERCAIGPARVKKGDRVIVTIGVPVTKGAKTNLMLVRRIGDPIKD